MNQPRRSPRGEDRKRDPERTRERILDAAVAEFGEHGFAGARISAAWPPAVRRIAGVGAGRRCIDGAGRRSSADEGHGDRFDGSRVNQHVELPRGGSYAPGGRHDCVSRGGSQRRVPFVVG